MGFLQAVWNLEQNDYMTGKTIEFDVLFPWKSVALKENKYS